MANDLVIKLLLKTGAFSNDLKVAKGQIQNFKNGCKQAGGALGELTKGLGINVGSLSKFGGAVGAAVLAVKGYSKVMQQNRDFMDDWGRATETAKGLWEGFKNSLATGASINLTSIAETSKQYYDVMDNLRSVQHAIGDQLEVNNTKYQHLISIARDVALADVDRLEALNKANELVEANIKLQKRQAQEEKNAADIDLKRRLARHGVKDADPAAIAAMMGLDENNRFVYENRWEELNAAVQRGAVTTNMSTNYGVISQTTYTEEAQAILDSFEYKLARALYNIGQSDNGQKAIDDYFLKVANNMGMEIAEYNAQQSRTEIDRLRKRIMGKEGSGSGKGIEEPKAPPIVGSIDYYDDLIKKYKEEQNNVEINSRRYRELAIIIKNLQDEYDKLMLKTQPLKKIDISKLAPANYGLGEIKETGLKIRTPEPPKDTTEEWKNFNNVLSQSITIANSVGNAFSSTTENIAQSILTMVATSLPALGSLITSIAALTGVEAVGKAVTTSKNWIEAIAAVAALGAAVIGAISMMKNNAKSAGKFANGGIVGGSSYTGDRLVANVNSGEMILNTIQQSKLWKQINTGGTSGQVEFYISGDSLVGVLNNSTRKSRTIR